MTEAGSGSDNGSAAVDLPEAIKNLSELWVEDEELHQFRSESVLTTAEQLRDSGLWASTCWIASRISAPDGSRWPPKSPPGEPVARGFCPALLERVLTRPE